MTAIRISGSNKGKEKERNPLQNYTKWTEALFMQEQDRGNEIKTVGYSVDIFDDANSHI